MFPMVPLHIITGGAGFIGANLARMLVERGERVLIIDNLSRGKRDYIDAIGAQDRIAFVQADLSDAHALDAALAQVAADDPVEVWHLCANSDIPAGVNDPSIDLRDTFIVTFELLQAMRARGWSQLHFASTSAVYGDHGSEPLSEESFVEPISNYGAMKLASEAAIRAWCESTQGSANVFRFPNVVGTPATHGVLIDFVRKMKADPTMLPVLGDGTQCKAYLHVSDLLNAMLFVRDKGLSGYHVFNVGPRDHGITVREIAEIARDRVAPHARLVFGTENRGWIGDVPKFRYDVSKLERLGWSTPRTSHEAIRHAINEIATQEGAQLPE